MTDTNDTNGSPGPDEGKGGTTPEESRAPKRVIGTPSQTGAATLVPAAGPPDEGHSGPPAIKLDEKQAKRVERVVALCFFVTFLAGAGFLVFYAVWPGTTKNTVAGTMHSNYALGGALTVALLGMAIGMTIWIRRLMTSPEMVQDRGTLATPEEDRRYVAEYLVQGAEESGLVKRRLLRRTLLLASVPLGIAPIFLLRDLGPLPGKSLRYTYWKAGMRLRLDGVGTPIKATDFGQPGQIITVIPPVPESDSEYLDIIAKATVLLINIPVNELKILPGRENWHVGGIIAYSKICTHVGCPAALYERTTHHILCPCHQSTFDAADGAKVIFGPAARSLPQLPIGVDDEGYLIATSGFHEPVGPSFWERGSVNGT
jgi:ubiquinol-cytochrome c reductase iron-sulfur subunit